MIQRGPGQGRREPDVEWWKMGLMVFGLVLSAAVFTALSERHPHAYWMAGTAALAVLLAMRARWEIEFWTLVLFAALWPSTCLFLPSLVFVQERERRLRLVREVMES